MEEEAIPLEEEEEAIPEEEEEEAITLEEEQALNTTSRSNRGGRGSSSSSRRTARRMRNAPAPACAACACTLAPPASSGVLFPSAILKLKLPAGLQRLKRVVYVGETLAGLFLFQVCACCQSKFLKVSIW